MNVSKLIVGLVVAGFSLASFALTGDHTKAAAGYKHMNNEKHPAAEKIVKGKMVKKVVDKRQD